MNLFMKFDIHGKAGICYDNTYLQTAGTGRQA